MRVLCSTTPMEGVFGPFLPLGRALIEQGDELIIATGPDLPTRAGTNGMRFAPAGLSAMDGAMAAMGDAEVQAAPPGDRVRFPAAMFGAVIPAAKLPALRTLAASWRPDLIVHPPVDLAGPLLAAELGVPSVCYGFGQPFDATVVEAIAVRVSPLWEAAALVPDSHGGIYRGLYLDPCPPSLAVDDEVPAADGVRRIRPEVPGDVSAALPAWARELGTRPVVYVSLGTAPQFNQPASFAPLLDGLAGTEAEVVVTVSRLHDPDALGELGPTVHVEQWLPLAPLLARCDAVVCHAGTGTTLASLAAGLPLVLIPQGADQFDNARACQRAGAARVLLGDQVTPNAVREAVDAVLPDASPERTAARGLAAEIAAMPSSTEVAHTLKAFAERAHAAA
ncbi:MAG TPA: glycosyltransferase [Solirubrobacteraceae bacterium]|jgi:UDP:flavonoid glycosyltransferase YjiC (YdhE family)|nr:glycosyltransferase [Solirubrobacteraceae bacterium]